MSIWGKRVDSWITKHRADVAGIFLVCVLCVVLVVTGAVQIG